MPRVVSARERNELRISRIVAEYREMPGLSLTPAQAARLCGIASSEADRIMRHLEAAGMLTRTSTGAYLLRGD